MGIVRVLLLADTHLGFDLTFRPRIERRRRGPDFFANFQRALRPALEGRVDCVVHGGDLLFRSKVPARLVSMAFKPLKQVADSGIPVYLVPGNHERSAIPHRHLGEHARIHIFDSPQTFRMQKNSISIALAGFPFVRHGIGSKFTSLIDQTGCHRLPADIYLLCIHQSVEGATVGPVGYMFRRSPDVIGACDIPGKFSAVLAGHIHRFQVLTTDLHAPVFYPGSIERTSFAERDEKKGYLILEFGDEIMKGGALRNWQFQELPARPMIQLNLHASGMTNADLRAWIGTRLAAIPEDGIVKLKIHDTVSHQAMEVLSAPALRALAPATMNIDAVFVENRKLLAMKNREKWRKNKTD